MVDGKVRFRERVEFSERKGFNMRFGFCSIGVGTYRIYPDGKFPNFYIIRTRDGYELRIEQKHLRTLWEGGTIIALS